MKIIGLTGSIAAGKSTVAGWVRDLGIAIHDADAAVHELLGPDGAAVADIIGVFGADTGSIATGIDRQALGNLVFANPPRRKQLEAILHPMVREHRDTLSIGIGQRVHQLFCWMCRYCLRPAVRRSVIMLLWCMQAPQPSPNAH